MNYFLILGPIGMILIGLLAIIIWQRRYKVKPIFFGWGGILWFIAMLLKAVMDFTITQPLLSSVQAVMPSILLLLTSLLVGLRTGFFESGISYLLLKTRIKKIQWKEAMAIGIGFGGLESIVLGALSLTGFIVLLNPAFIALLSETELEVAQAQLNQNTLIIFASWIERFFTLIAHVFSTVLVIKAITSNNLKFLWGSIAYKSLLDAPVPLFQTLVIGGDIIITYIVEIYIISMGMVGYYGIKWLSKKEPFTQSKEAVKRKRK